MEKLNRIVELSSVYFGMTKEELTEKCRNKEIVRARNFIMYLSAVDYDINHKAVVDALGLATHVSCTYAIKVMTKKIQGTVCLDELNDYRKYIKEGLGQ